MTTESCPRCHRTGVPIGPWNGEGGGFKRLCTKCKFEITLTPERTAKIEKHFRAVIQSAIVEKP